MIGPRDGQALRRPTVHIGDPTRERTHGGAHRPARRPRILRHRQAQRRVRQHRRIVHPAHGHRRVVVRAGTAVAIRQHKPHGAGAGGRRIGVGILIGDALDQRRHRRRRGIAVQRDDEVAAAAAPGAGPDGGAAIGDIAAAHADLARPGALVPNTEHILRTIAPSRNGDGQGAGI